MSPNAPAALPPGCNIYRLRVEAGLSMRALAERCDPELDHTTIRRLERNAGYTQDTLERVAKALHVSVETLFLPPELQDWPALSSQKQARIAESIRDAATAQRYKTTG
ncbi:MAG: helix-turn-helix transcriptional regulator [Gammaproteobacteria bacterium]